MCILCVIIIKITYKDKMRELEKAIIANCDKLRMYAVMLTMGKGGAEDLLQETILRILSNEDKYNDVGNFISWAVVIMRNIFKNSLRYNVGRPTSSLDGYDVQDFSYEAVADESCPYDCEDIIATVESLPPMQAAMVKLRIVGYKYYEIAENMNVPIGTVKSALNSARNTLRVLLELDF